MRALGPRLCLSFLLLLSGAAAFAPPLATPCPRRLGPCYSTHRRRPISTEPQDTFLGNLTRLDLMGWDVLEPEEEGYKRLGLTVPDVDPEDFRDLPVRVKFGFETKRPMIEFYTPYALCYPANTRAKGCQELIKPGDGSSSQDLPCVQTGSCPFVTFTCSEGHTWRASPGTPACFYCPVCRHRTKRVRGQAEGGQSLLLSRVRTLEVISRLRQTAEARGGRLLSEVRGRRR